MPLPPVEGTFEDRERQACLTHRPLRYHTLSQREVGVCETCEDYRSGESRLDHLMRTAYVPEPVA